MFYQVQGTHSRGGLPGAVLWQEALKCRIEHWIAFKQVPCSTELQYILPIRHLDSTTCLGLSRSTDLEPLRVVQEAQRDACNAPNIVGFLTRLLLSALRGLGQEHRPRACPRPRPATFQICHLLAKGSSVETACSKPAPCCCAPWGCRGSTCSTLLISTDISAHISLQTSKQRHSTESLVLRRPALSASLRPDACMNSHASHCLMYMLHLHAIPG